MRESVSLDRLWFGLTFIAIGIGLVLQVALVAAADEGHFATPLSRMFNLFFFFTILSNILLGFSCLLLYLNPRRTSTAFRVVRLTGLIGIAVTGVVFHGILKERIDLHGWSRLADFILHTFAPIAGVLGWLIFGPRRLITPRVVGLTVIFPAVYGAVTVIRGEIVDWYPYFFMNPNENGYGQVALYSVVIAVLFVGLAAGAHELDDWLSSMRDAPDHVPA